MSTAILRFLASDGFVVGADGRQLKGNDTASDNTQKIFPLVDKDRQLVYALCGYHRFTSDDDTDILWDLRLEIESAIRAIGDRRSSNLAGYAVRLSRPIHRALKAAKEAHNFEFPEDTDRIDPYGKTIADVLLDGYYSGVPSRVRIRFFHNQQRLCAPEVSLGDLQILDLYGSAQIWHSFDDRTSPTLAAYRPPKYRETPWTAADAVKAIAGYMAACASEEGKKVDEKAHKIIGGRTHIAIVTPEGFRWAPGYDPLPDSQSTFFRFKARSVVGQFEVRATNALHTCRASNRRH